MLQKTLKPDSSPTYEQPIPGLSDIKFKSANAVGWHPTGFEHGSIGIKRAVLGPNLCLLIKSVGAVG